MTTPPGSNLVLGALVRRSPCVWSPEGPGLSEATGREVGREVVREEEDLSLLNSALSKNNNV